MNNFLLIFTFSPVQSFIAEARRAEDLFKGSEFLSKMAKSAADILKGSDGELIYPTKLTGNDAPNIIVARIPGNEKTIQNRADRAKIAVFETWTTIVNSAVQNMRSLHIQGADLSDDLWKSIWERQTKPETLWEIYWAAAPMQRETEYHLAYREARRALDALKRSRLFQPVESEIGQKDSLSGKRAALLTQPPVDWDEKKNGKWKAKDYWARVATNLPVTARPKVRPDGKERLDSIGAVKRFAPDNEQFLSTSSVATADFLQIALDQAGTELSNYREAVEKLLAGKIFRVRNTPAVWPYDGDLFYQESLTKERIKEDYGLERVDPLLLKKAHEGLERLYNATKMKPSTYYAVVVLDGDSMGKQIDAILNKPNAQEEHKEFSGKLSGFSEKVLTMVPDGFRVYNGGDDVLCIAPLAWAVEWARRLAKEFSDILVGSTASAGIAISHHQSPLDGALEAARVAEKTAKKVEGKASVCIRVLKRSGEILEIRSPWNALGTRLHDLTAHFKEQSLSSRLAYGVWQEAHALTALPSDVCQSALKRQLKRHSNENFSKEKIKQWSLELTNWASAMDIVLPKLPEGDNPGFVEMSKWLIFARFLASGGQE